MNNKKSLKVSLAIINISIVVLFALIFTLPWLVTWFVEVRQKDPGLPTVVMLTCYPCAPFAVTALFSLRKLIKNCLAGMIFGDKNITLLRIVAICCVASAVVTIVAGHYYIAFYVVSVAAVGCAIIVNAIKDVFSAELDSRREELLESVREEL